MHIVVVDASAVEQRKVHAALRRAGIRCSITSACDKARDAGAFQFPENLASARVANAAETLRSRESCTSEVRNSMLKSLIRSAGPMKRSELNLLVYLLSKPEQLISHMELIEGVFGGAHAEDTSLVRVHIHKLRRSLGARGTAIRTVRGFGYWVDSAALESHQGL